MNRDLLRLYFVMGSQDCHGRDLLAILEAALKGGITLFQFREKGNGSLVGQPRIDLAYRCQELCANFQVPFLVDDDVKLAVQMNADGAHVGQDDMAYQQARELLGSNRIIGVSANNLAEMDLAYRQGADYVGLQAMYATPSKADAVPVTSLDIVRQAREEFPDLPFVGIGGVKESNLDEVLSRGADGVAIISEIAMADNVEKKTRSLRKKIDTILVAKGIAS